jgi:hypothetical protein
MDRINISNILIHYVSQSVMGFWGVGEGEAGEAAGDRCQSVMGLDHHDFRTSHVYKPKPDLHKALQPSKGKE